MRKFMLFTALLLIAIESQAGKKGLNAVNVKLARTSGEAVRTVVTDANGHFTFPVVPKGSYAVKFGRDQLKGTTRSAIVEINGVKHEWDFEKSQLRSSGEDKIVVASDGQHAISGTVTEP